MTDRAELEALAAKYREMIALRREAGPRDDGRLRALATRFPGALRELDTRTMGSLEGRLAALENALEGGAVPAWAATVSSFHGWLRVALRMRAAGARDLEGARAWAAGYAATEPGDPPPVALDDARLVALAQPRGGRVSLAAQDALGVAEAELVAILFGSGARHVVAATDDDG